MMPTVTKVEIPAGTIPSANLIPGTSSGWGYRKWKAIGFTPAGHPPWRVPAGCSVAIRCGDLLGPESEPFREFERIEFVAHE